MIELDLELRRLVQKQKHLQEQHLELITFYGNLEEVENLWLYRTIPHLDILKKLHETLYDSPQWAVVILDKALPMLENVTKALGPLGIWYGDDALAEQALKVVQTQLTDPWGGVSKRCKDKGVSRKTLDVPRAQPGQEDSKISIIGAAKEDEPVEKKSSFRKTFRVGPETQELTGKKLHAKIDGWVPPENVTKCQGCNASFYLHWKHNCRKCGKVFCQSCTPHNIPIPELGYENAVRVCIKCVDQLVQAQV